MCYLHANDRKKKIWICDDVEIRFKLKVDRSFVVLATLSVVTIRNDIMSGMKVRWGVKSVPRPVSLLSPSP